MARPCRSAVLATLMIFPLICVSIAVWHLVANGQAAERREQARARATLVTYLDLVRRRNWTKACAMQDEDSGLNDANCKEFLSSGSRLVIFDVGRVLRTGSGIDGTFITFVVSLTYADGSHEQIEMQVSPKVSGYPDTVLDGPSVHTRKRPYDG